MHDVNPVPYGDELSLNVDEEDNSISIDLAVQTAVRFGISESDAEAQAEEILKIVRDNWEKTAAGYGLARRQIEEMRPHSALVTNKIHSGQLFQKESVACYFSVYAAYK